MNDATWTHTFFSSGAWTSAGGDFNSVASATTAVSISGGQNWSSAQMVVDVQSWLDSGSNFGWILVGDEGTDGSAKGFSSREDGTAANRPQLTIDFTTVPVELFKFSIE